jgi:hypothetical protein
MQVYLDLLRDVVANGQDQADRTGVGRARSSGGRCDSIWRRAFRC